MKVLLVALLPCFAVLLCTRAEAALSPADFLGPDGIVYPDWTWAGVPGGIPDVPVVAHLAEFGARPDDDADDSRALQRAVDDVGEKGGGALLIEAGTYHLDRPVIITHDNVVVRGRGPDQTRLINRYGPPESGVAFFLPQDGDEVNEDSWIEVHCQPDGLNAIRILVDGEQAYSRTRSQHWGGTFAGKTSGSSLLRDRPNGPHQLTAVAEFDDGERAEATIDVLFKRLPEGTTRARPIPSFLGAITFVGDSLRGPQLLLAADAERGDTELQLNSTEGLSPGDSIVLTAPATERWNKLVQNACKWGSYRRNEYRVEGIEGNTVRLNQPLRIPFATIDDSYVQKFRPIRRCGVEGLYIEQTQKLWTSGVIFSYAWECWARDVHVRKCGQWPVYTTPAKWCEIRDCRFDDAWYHGGGGTAYTGFQNAYDCLMENVRTTKMRHAPCLQWSASGNVIRKCTFVQSDGQWHAGWTNENLFEQCVIDAAQGTGSYGNGFWGSPPHDTAHGPNGPRNVVYNCDVVAPKNGIWMGGMNQGWIILHNRLVCGAGPGVFMKINSDAHTIAHNVFVLQDGKSPGIRIDTDDCDGVRAIGNAFYGGGGVVVAGPGKLAETTDNTLNQLPRQGIPARPTPAVPSIFEWQRAQTTRHARAQVDRTSGREPSVRIGLAGWAIVHRFKDEDNPLPLLDYFKVAKDEMGIDAVELNNVFMESHDDEYLQQIVNAAQAAGVKMLGMAVDGTGDLSLVDEEKRRASVANAMEYFDIAQKLGLQYFRVNTGGKPEGGEETIQACIKSFRELGEEGQKRGIAIATENHGGISYNPDVMVRIIEEVGLPSVRTLPDFGNFPDEIRYEGIEKIMPYAIAVHAKWHLQDGTRFDIPRLVEIVKKSGFDGYIFIEDSGFRHGQNDREGILELNAEIEGAL